MSATIFTVNSYIETKKQDVGRELALDIANYVADAIVDGVTTKSSLPAASYERILEVPPDLAGRSYYIEVTEAAVYVNSTDGSISRTCSNYNAENMHVGISSPSLKVYPSTGKIKVFCNETRFVHRFDFGNSTSPLEPGYERVTPGNATDWYNITSRYRINITINNTVSEDELDNNISAQNLTYFQYPISLYPANFDYSKAMHNGSDLNFTNATGKKLPFWIEYWNPNGMSRVWVKFGNITINQKITFHMYFGNNTQHPNPDPHNSTAAEKVFVFYDHFEDPVDDSWWTTSSGVKLNSAGHYAEIPNDNQGMITTKGRCNLTNFNKDNFSGYSSSELLRYIKYTGYVVEAKIRLDPWPPSPNNNTHIVVLSQNNRDQKGGSGGNAIYTDIMKDSYDIVSRKQGSPGFEVIKRNVTGNQTLSIDTPDTPNMPNNWSLVRIGIIIGTSWKYSNPKFNNFTYIGALRKNFTLYNKTEQPISLQDYCDSASPSASPYREGNIGFCCDGNLPLAHLYVDWVRIYQYLTYQLNVTFGDMESTDYHWKSPPLAMNRDGPTNLARDFNYGKKDESRRFEIRNMSAGTYSITITIGDSNITSIQSSNRAYNCYGMQINVSTDGGSSFRPVTQILNYVETEFKTICFNITKDKDDSSLQFEFNQPYPEDPLLKLRWVINALTIEQGIKGVKLEEYYE